MSAVSQRMWIVNGETERFEVRGGSCVVVVVVEANLAQCVPNEQFSSFTTVAFEEL